MESEKKDREDKGQKKFAEEVFGERRRREVRKKRADNEVDVLRQHLVSRNIIREEGE